MSRTGRKPEVISLLSSSDVEDALPTLTRQRQPITSIKENLHPRYPKNATTSKYSSSDTSKSTSLTFTNELQTRVTDPTKVIKPQISKNVKKSTKIYGTLASDPILSQSSPPRKSPSRSPPLVKKISKPLADFLASDGLSADDDDDWPKRVDRQPDKPTSQIYDSKLLSNQNSNITTKELLRMYQVEDDEERVKKRRKVTKNTLDISDIESSSSESPISRPKSNGNVRTKSKISEEEKAARKLEKELKAAEKAAEKDIEKERKKIEKEEKLKEKNETQAIATANKLKGSHVVTATEMIVNISSELYSSTTGNQLKSFLDTLKVPHKSFISTVPNIVKWQRSVTAEWVDDEDFFVPIPKEVRDEKHVLIVLEAKDFVDWANQPAVLEKMVTDIRLSYPVSRLIIIIEGLAKLISKSKSNHSRVYAAEVRNRMNRGTGGIVRINKTAEAVDEDKIEDALLRLQVIYNCLICQTVSYMDSAEAISSYTQHISQIPYKNAKATLNKTTSFCMDVGQVKTGINSEDTFHKMLQCVHMSTDGVAHAIQSQYCSVQALVQAFSEQGDDALRNIAIARNRAGHATGRALGPAMSRKIARIMTGQDEWELES